MSKKELIILAISICILISLNIVNYIRREHQKQNYTLLVEEIKVQMSINEAAMSELMNLPGIGPSIAQRIVEYREMNGEFKKLEDVKKVKGIGDKLFQKILPYIKL